MKIILITKTIRFIRLPVLYVLQSTSSHSALTFYNFRLFVSKQRKITKFTCSSALKMKIPCR